MNKRELVPDTSFAVEWREVDEANKHVYACAYISEVEEGGTLDDDYLDVAAVTVKWDGCTYVDTMESTIHLCGPHHIRALGRALEYVYRGAFARMGVEPLKPWL